MSGQVTTVIGQPLADNPQRGGFRCFCGEWFPSRIPFDEHLKSHPGKFAVCDCCKRVLPKGSWRVDEDGTFISTAEPQEWQALSHRESAELSAAQVVLQNPKITRNPDKTGST